MKQAFLIGAFLLICALMVTNYQPQGAQLPAPEPSEALPWESLLAEEAADFEVQAVTAMAEVEPISTPQVTYYDGSITISVLIGDEVQTMTLTDYVAGVVAAEMPASFHPEALKAQAVAARTNVMRKLISGGKHENCVVCGESTCCMGWREPEDQAFIQAAEETDGQVMTYQGAIIDALFFSSSWGSTEDAVEVWGSAVPYLSSVESQEAEIRTETVTVPLRDICLKVMELYPQADFSGQWISDLEYTDSGSVRSAKLGGVALSGKEIRSMFGLKSACFTVELTANGAAFTTMGYGHGVGMSQYGADAMARAGSSYDQILTWYYSGSVLESLSA